MSLFFKLNNLIAKISTLVILTIGLSLIIASAVISLVWVPTKLFSIIIVSGGTFLGSMVMFSSITKTIALKLEDEKKEKEKEIKTRIAMEDKILRSKEIEIQRNNLENEITSLKSMKLDVNSISRIADLGVAKADMIIRDFRRSIISKEATGIVRNEQREYIGLLEYAYTAKLGIDLLKLRFFQTDNIIEISGLKTETLGILLHNNEKDPWLLQEIRSLKTNDKFKFLNSYEIEKDSEDLNKCSHEQRNQLENMISNGTNLKHLDEYIIKLTQDFLLLLLSPLKKEIRFVNNENVEGKELVHFLTENNNLIEEKIRILEKQYL